jgi:uncharacterized protein (UPF0548 family)
MFFARRPSPATIDRFLRDSQDLPLSYGPVGTVSGGTVRAGIDEAVTIIGRGRADFDRARVAIAAWKHFELGWVELFPRCAPVVVGTVVAVQIRHLGFWSLNGCRVLYGVGAGDNRDRFGFAYGTLTNHAESGEELFEVFIDPRTDDVKYRIRATSRGQTTLARAGQPIVRLLQARFRRDSAAAMTRAVRDDGRSAD